jgi:hypothetical protein
MAGEIFPDETDDDFCMMASPSFREVKIQNSKLNIQNLTAASALPHPLSGRLFSAPMGQCLSNRSADAGKGGK